MRSATIAWYYVILAVIVMTALIFVDFSNVNNTVQLVLVLSLVLLIANPILMFWISEGGEERLRQIFGNPDAQLQSRNQELEKQLATLNQEVNQLRSLEKSKTEFVAMTAHQLRTPLSAIKWTFHMIMNGELGPVTTDQRSFLEKGYEHAEKVIAVVNEWLNLDYLKANQNHYQFVPAELSELVDSVAFEFHERIKEKDLELIVKKPSQPPPPVELDPIKFGMILENLVDNAIKYTPNGGRVTVTIDDQRLSEAEPRLEISVADTGIGIPKAEQDRLFQQFFRSSNAAALSPRGSGLGLYIIKNLVEGHHGEISFDSEEGKGTKFTITIPLKQKRL